MKFSVDTEVLLGGIHSIQNAIHTRSALPILSNIHLEAAENHLTLTGTDLEIGIATTLPAQVQEPGVTTLPARRLNDLIKELPSCPLTIAVKKNHIAVMDCGTSHFKLIGLPPEDFPKLPTIAGAHTFSIPQETLSTMLSLVSFAMSHDETRYVLNGTLFSAQKGKLRLVATDGRRLAMMERTIPTSPTTDTRAIIPTKAVHELSRLLGSDGEAHITFQKNQVKFHLGPTTILSRTIEGEFPNYEQVVPVESPTKVKIPRENLLLAIRRVSLWTTQESQAIRLDATKNKLIISKQSQELGEAREEVDAEYGGQELSVGFNPTYLMDVLRSLPDGMIEMEIVGPERPGVVRTQDHYTYIVLPMQLT